METAASSPAGARRTRWPTQWTPSPTVPLTCSSPMTASTSSTHPTTSRLSMCGHPHKWCWLHDDAPCVSIATVTQANFAMVAGHRRTRSQQQPWTAYCGSPRPGIPNPHRGQRLRASSSPECARRPLLPVRCRWQPRVRAANQLNGTNLPIGCDTYFEGCACMTRSPHWLPQPVRRRIERHST